MASAPEFPVGLTKSFVEMALHFQFTLSPFPNHSPINLLRSLCWSMILGFLTYDRRFVPNYIPVEIPEMIVSSQNFWHWIPCFFIVRDFPPLLLSYKYGAKWCTSFTWNYRMSVGMTVAGSGLHISSGLMAISLSFSILHTVHSRRFEVCWSCLPSYKTLLCPPISQIPRRANSRNWVGNMLHRNTSFVRGL